MNKIQIFIEWLYVKYVFVPAVMKDIEEEEDVRQILLKPDTSVELAMYEKRFNTLQ